MQKCLELVHFGVNLRLFFGWFLHVSYLCVSASPGRYTNQINVDAVISRFLYFRFVDCFDWIFRCIDSFLTQSINLDISCKI